MIIAIKIFYFYFKKVIKYRHLSIPINCLCIRNFNTFKCTGHETIVTFMNELIHKSLSTFNILNYYLIEKYFQKMSHRLNGLATKLLDNRYLCSIGENLH